MLAGGVEVSLHRGSVIVGPSYLCGESGHLRFEILRYITSRITAQSVGFASRCCNDLVGLGSSGGNLTGCGAVSSACFGQGRFTDSTCFAMSLFFDLVGTTSRPVEDPILGVKDRHHCVIYRYPLGCLGLREISFEFADPLRSAAGMAF